MIRMPVILFTAEHDAWVQHASMKRAASSLGNNLERWFLIAGGLHRLPENPRKARVVYQQLTQCCQLKFGYSLSNGVMEPPRKIVAYQSKAERNRTNASLAQAELSGFWKDYLEHFHYIVNFADYQQLLDHIIKLMGPNIPGTKVLEAGCGNGNFGTFLYRQELLRARRDKNRTARDLHYVGIDFVSPALRQANHKLHEVMVQNPSSRLKMSHAFQCVDMNAPLPFPDKTFDKIVSNLVLGYLNNPESTLRELYRVLTPGGTIVLTNLKPNSDLSRIYSNFVQTSSTSKELEEAKQLLNNSGKIREAEGKGIFHFHTQRELLALLHHTSHGSQPRVFSTFADQAYIAVLSKSRSHCQPQNTSELLQDAA